MTVKGSNNKIDSFSATEVHSGLCTKTGLVIYLAFLAKVANHYNIVLTRVGSSDYCLFHRKENLDLGRM